MIELKIKTVEAELITASQTPQMKAKFSCKPRSRVHLYKNLICSKRIQLNVKYFTLAEG